MQMSSFGINDSIVAAPGLGIVVWMGLIYAELLLRNRILRAIFKKYPKTCMNYTNDYSKRYFGFFINKDLKISQVKMISQKLLKIK